MTETNPASPRVRGQSVPAESLIFTEELQTRPSRPPDYESESRALVQLTRALAESPDTILQQLSDTILEVCRAGSAGVSLLSKEDGGKSFHWPAISGRWKRHIGGGTPRDFGPCGDVLDRNRTLLMRQVERRYAYFGRVTPLVQEALLVPFYVQGKAVGTIWAVAHHMHHKFEAEDKRLLESLGKFASAAYQTLQREEQMRALAENLNRQVNLRTHEVGERNAEVLLQTRQLRELSQRLLQMQDDERRRLSRELHDSAGQTLTAVSLHLAGIAQQASTPELRRSAEESLVLTEQLGREIRTVSYLLHPPMLEETGLRQALRWFAKGLEDRGGLQIQLRIPEDLGRFHDDLELAIFRIVQECLTNIHRHSGSDTATIQLSRDGQTLALEVWDQGTGMSEEKLAGLDQSSGVGIAGMRERVRHLNGQMTVESDATGTKIKVVLPMIAPAAAAATP